ncbi:N,N-dimethylformamidase beta subunit family domain-containing protein [Streptomyces sp. NBC_01217]|uniref:N,N-dimethylformamidase beta subunit family domain-containing protein n=1 Tax=Streptomyces sp. NBC_01217 TaxID=2903779 RepID=UPI002E0D565C|nr:GldG family protein [Streptomyces sp. NBC_01217]
MTPEQPSLPKQPGIRAWAERTSCAQGGRLTFHLDHSDSDPDPASGRVLITDAVTDEVRLSAPVTGPTWTLDVPHTWPSSLYRATFDPATFDPAGATTDEAEHEVWFVVRTARPGSTSPVLVSIPFATWRAYTHSGQPGRSIYFAEQPDRASRVSFASPGGGPPPERWEEGLLRWLPRAGYRVEFCSGLDLHDGDELLAHYRLLVINGHDEYWSMEMRDSVEAFARRGGNLAVFAANTAWWQMRLEDDRRTMVCHRDSVTDPMTAIDPRRVTVEWSSSPVDRPENTMTGVSFRRGAGAWGEGMALIRKEAYTARFGAHWVFDGTGLADGDPFARGALGYETDACALEWIGDVPRATGSDSTPSSFVVLATADLRHWRDYGQGGAATMGIFRLGAGTVFNAATINWGSVLDEDPVADRITRNVLDRLSGAAPGDAWEIAGAPAEVHALAVCEGVLFGVDGAGSLLCREPSGQNLPWRRIGEAPGVRALASSREAAGALPLELYAATDDGLLLRRDPVAGPAEWHEAGTVPPGITALALCDAGVFAVTPHDDTLHHLSALEPHAPWRVLGDAGGAVALTTMNCRLWAVTADGRLRTRLPEASGTKDAGFTDCSSPGPSGGCDALAARAGTLYAAGSGGPLRIRRQPAI